MATLLWENCHKAAAVVCRSYLCDKRNATAGVRNAEAGSGSESVKSDVHRVPEDRLQQRAGWTGARSTVLYSMCSVRSPSRPEIDRDDLSYRGRRLRRYRDWESHNEFPPQGLTDSTHTDRIWIIHPEILRRTPD